MMTAFDKALKKTGNKEGFRFTDEAGQEWAAFLTGRGKYAVQAKKDGKQKTAFEIKISPDGGYDVSTTRAYFRS